MTPSDTRELCKQVYERLGWESKYFFTVRGKVVPGDRLFGSTPVPAYDLEFILEKLAHKSERNIKLYYAVVERVWKCEFAGYGSPSRADTPLNATLKLALALDELGLLEKEKQ